VQQKRVAIFHPLAALTHAHFYNRMTHTSSNTHTHRHTHTLSSAFCSCYALLCGTCHLHAKFSKSSCDSEVL